jgi:hypothetical protein
MNKRFSTAYPIRVLIIFCFLVFSHNVFAATDWAVVTDDGFQRANTSLSTNPGGAGNGWVDQLGNRANINGDKLLMTNVNANEYNNAYLTRPSSEGTADERIVEFVDLMPADNIHWASSVLRWHNGVGQYFYQFNTEEPSIQVFYVDGAGAPHQVGVSVNPGTYHADHYYALDAQIVGSSITYTIYDQGMTPPAQTGAIPAFGTQLAQFTGTDATVGGSSSTVLGVAVNSNTPGQTTKYLRVITYEPLPAITLTSPSTRQVFQRNGTTGSISISGSQNSVIAHDIEASFNGGSYQTIATNAAPGAFSGTLTGQAQGEGTVTVRLKDLTNASASVNNVGIGDVFVIAGQSNASGRATNNQSYTSSGGLTASLYGNDNVWHDLTDPTDSPASQVDVVSKEDSNSNALGSSQGSPGGSYWPKLASYIIANQNVPVAFIPTALGGTGIALWQPGANHEDRTTLYGSMVYRALAVGGVRAVLWHQGETDAHNAMSQSTYTADLAAIAAAIHSDLGVKLVPAKLQSGGTYASQSNLNTVNAAIAAEWAGDANVAGGADLSGLTVDDGFAHLQSDANMASAGQLWWNSLRDNIYPGVPIVSTNDATAVATSTFTLNGSITGTGGASANQSGFAYGISPNLLTTIATTTDGAQSGLASFSHAVSSLNPNTLYYFRAYATNSTGTGFGSILSTTTLAISSPTITTQNVSSISAIAATGNGNIISTGNINASTQGVVYGTALTYGATTTSSGDFGNGAFISSISGLSCNTLYHVAAFAANSQGVSYGGDVSFTTSACDSGGGSGISSTGGVSVPANGPILGSLQISNQSEQQSTASTSIGTFAPNTPSSPSGQIYVFPFNRQLWDRGEDIRNLQKYFNQHGYLVSPTGLGSPGNEIVILGTKTVAAIQKFQKANGIPTTGYFGPKTRAKLNSILQSAQSGT